MLKLSKKKAAQRRLHDMTMRRLECSGEGRTVGDSGVRIRLMLYRSSPIRCVLTFRFSNRTSGQAAVNTLAWRLAIYRTHWLNDEKQVNYNYLYVGPGCGYQDYKKRKDKTHKRAPKGGWDEFLSCYIQYALHLLGSVTISRRERILKECNTIEDNDREILLSRLALFGFLVRSFSFIFLFLPPLTTMRPALYEVILGLTNPSWPTFCWNPDLCHLISLTRKFSNSVKRDVKVMDSAGVRIKVWYVGRVPNPKPNSEEIGNTKEYLRFVLVLEEWDRCRCNYEITTWQLGDQRGDIRNMQWCKKLPGLQLVSWDNTNLYDNHCHSSKMVKIDIVNRSEIPISPPS